MLRRVLQLPSAASALTTNAKILAAAPIAACYVHPDQNYRITSRRHFMDLHKMVDKEAIKKANDRLKDELSRGYFADLSEIRKNSGKIAPANKTLIPSVAAAKFPDIVVHFPDGTSIKLPLFEQNGNNNSTDEIIPTASLLCLSFRASSQRMAESWSVPFLESLDTSTKIQVYEVSFVESWLLSLNPMKNLFLKIARSSSNPLRRFAYFFGDHYDLRKKLQIVNLLTGYIFLLDGYGRIRWQGFGSATPEEVSSLVSSTSLLLEE
ncbi:mitochondrial ATPase complex subunit ATP10 isoform X2 [Phalaenopsis equestris]|uniref:mitochondrial ATPase complex subunit ATP10 isoform X2 n=1 Tax=Phalaenopsis equestris TaxID=78828 RepID=UPI0009E2D6A8|nr:mitochondrial ATPase complex subunit ATP10 isoform X2 [Phalaenopsis equestris]